MAVLPYKRSTDHRYVAIASYKYNAYIKLTTICHIAS